MTVSMREMLEAGVHFGHQTRFWNPKMAPYIYGHRNKIHIINLEKTQPLFDDAMKFVRQLAASRGTILMIGTKRQAREVIALEAQRCGMPYVDQRWLGGMLTNFKTVKASLKKLKDMQAQKEAGIEQMIKKEGADVRARAGQAREGHRRHPGHERAARRDVRHRRRLPQDRHCRSQEAGHSADRRGRHQPLADRHRLRHPRQRRLGQGRGAVRARRVPTPCSKARPTPPTTWCRLSVPAATSSSRCAKAPERRRRRGRCGGLPCPPATPPRLRGRAGRSVMEKRDARNYRKHGRRTARQDRRPDDGVQEGPDRGRRRHGARRGDPARQARQQGRQGRVAHHRRRRGRRRPSTAPPARWSKSTAKPTSSRRTTTSWPSAKAVAELVAEQQPGRRGRAVGAAAVAGRLRPDASKTCARA